VRRLARLYRRSPASGGLVLVLGAAILVLLVGPRHDRTAALVVIALTLLIILGSAGAMAVPRARAAERRRESREPRERDEEDPPSRDRGAEER
jgi:hypothetical protein